VQSCRPRGAIIDLTFYQDGADCVRLGEEFHHNGLTIRCAQIARVPRVSEPSWDRRRLVEVTSQLVRARGPALLRHLVTDVVPFSDAARVMTELADRRRHAIQLVIAFNAPGDAHA
jgi:threonine dehydrogenase-like Zn-dependent dehydrogenase